MRRAALAVVVAAAGVGGAQPALGTYLVSRDVTKPDLAVDATAHGLVSYTEKGQVRRLLVYDAINALAPKPGARQVEFKIDYSGGWNALKKADYYKTIKNACAGRYDGPPLAFKVFACKAKDGSYWALQRWQRMLPNLGFAPWRPEQSVEELHISHWRGPLPVLKVSMNWAWGGRYQQLVGTYTYDGQPVYGFKSTSASRSTRGAGTCTWTRSIRRTGPGGSARTHSSPRRRTGASALVRAAPALSRLSGFAAPAGQRTAL
jgi:hypothetical protein